MGFDPGEEVGDFGEDAGGSGAGASAPGDDAHDVELAGLGLGWADEGTAGVAHASRAAHRTESDHTGPDHLGPTGLQVRVRPDLALKLLKGVGHVSRRLDETPAGEPTSFGAVVVVSFVGHAGGAGVSGGEVNVFGQLDQSHVVLNLVGSVEFRVNDDLLDLDVFFGSVVIVLVPFSDADAEFGGVLGHTEAVSGAKDPAGSDEGTSANVLFLVVEGGSVSERNLPWKFSVGSWETVDDTASGSLQTALLERQSGRHEGGQDDQNLHFLCLSLLSKSKKNNS